VTLEKLVLEAIHVYWMSLAWIPEGILEKDQKNLFQIYLGMNKIQSCCPLDLLGRSC
jgi:hypothetical protein